ncbi:MAG: SDR family oxidoreductase [Anaerolineae bacterium]|nr:SDR family oxidoreductase [Anaerolineales bacterium]MCQ3978644.1 NAD(P)-dependent oxidoreductase [Anaerolineae bacterium]
MTASHTPNLLVTGASGQLGRRVVELLLEAKAGHVIAATRNPEKLADLAARGVEVRRADFDDPASLTTAFAGVDRLLLISTDAVGEPGRRLAQHRAAVAAAVKAGVKHVVYTSLTRPEPGTPITLADSHYGTEQALAESPLDWTVLRNNVYTDVLLMSLPQAVAMGQLVDAAGNGGTGYVTREDCARAAAAVLAAPPAGRVTLDITGPNVVTCSELAQIVSEISGRPVSYASVTPDVMQNILVGAGLPPVYAEALVSFDTAKAQGFLGVATTTVAELTGAAPQSVRDFLLAHKEALLPQPA